MLSEKGLRTLNKIIPIISGALFVSLLFFPPIKFPDPAPAFEFIDFLLPVVALILFFKRKEIVQKKFLYIALTFTAFIFITIIVNARVKQMLDYFELFKMVKFLLMLYLFSFVTPTDFFRKWIKPAFIFLVVLNLAQYYNLFNINSHLEHLFFGNKRYSEFGLNSIGIPTYKRMIGFSINPNINAIIFMIFAILFIPKKSENNKAFIWFFVAMIMMFLCQSRTTMLALVPILLIYGVLMRTELKKIGLALGLVVVSFLISFTITKFSVGVELRLSNSNESVASAQAEPTYLEGIIRGDIANSSSMLGRYEVWKHLWGMIKEKPFFGHAPYKEYFYENVMYSENEFILILWRYGFIGLFIYLAMLTSLLVLALKNLHLNFGFNLLLILTLIMVTSITNNPLANKTIIILFALVIGLFFNEIRHSKKESDKSSD